MNMSLFANLLACLMSLEWEGSQHVHLCQRGFVSLLLTTSFCLQSEIEVYSALLIRVLDLVPTKRHPAAISWYGLQMPLALKYHVASTVSQRGIKITLEHQGTLTL